MTSPPPTAAAALPRQHTLVRRPTRIVLAATALLAACTGTVEVDTDAGSDEGIAQGAHDHSSAHDHSGDRDADAPAPEELSNRSTDEGSTDEGSAASGDTRSDGGNANEEAGEETAPDGRGTASGDSELVVTFLDVGQADATLLEVGDTTVLIDAGHWQRSQVVDHLAAHNIDQLDLLLITHPHADHIGEFDQILDTTDVDEVWWSGATTDSATFERAEAALAQHAPDYNEPRTGDTSDIGPLHLEVVNPPEDVGLSDLHDSGLAVRVTFGAATVLFTGDAEASTEQRMVDLSAGQLDADVLQVGHHGSYTSTTAPFLEAVDPDIAVYSAGAGNSYGHPHDEPLARLADRGVEVYGTDIDGTVVASTDGAGWDVTFP